MSQTCPRALGGRCAAVLAVTTCRLRMGTQRFMVNVPTTEGVHSYCGVSTIVSSHLHICAKRLRMWRKPYRWPCPATAPAAWASLLIAVTQQPMQAQPRSRDENCKMRKRGSVQADTLCAALTEARESIAGVSCFLLTQFSTDKLIWECSNRCYPSAQACSEARLLQLRGIPS